MNILSNSGKEAGQVKVFPARQPVEPASRISRPRHAPAPRHATPCPTTLRSQVVFHAHFHVIPRFAGDGIISCKPSRGSVLTAAEAEPLLAKMATPAAPAAAYAKSLAALDSLTSQLRAGEVVPPPPPPAPSAGKSSQKATNGKVAAGKAAAGTAGDSKSAMGGDAAAAPPAAAAATPAQGKPEGGKPEGGKGGPPEGKTFNTEKKVKVKKKAPEGAAAAAPVEDRPIDVSWADVRVGLIVDAVPHPRSDKLYVETIDLGEGSPRQILSGLANFMTLEQVKGARVVCICNLKPRKMADIESQGMVLCTNNEDHTQVCFVDPPEGTKPGDRVTWEGFPGEPMDVKKMDKKKGWEAISPEFKTDADGVATYKGAKWMVGGSPCTSVLRDAMIK